MSSTDVKQVSETVAQIAEVGERARRLNESMSRNIADLHEGLSVAEDVDRELRAASAALRGALGTQTNNPPKGDDGGGPGGTPLPDKPDITR